MARTPKAPPVLTPAEKKEVKLGLKTQLANVNAEHAKYVSDHKAAEKALGDIEKAATKARAEVEKNFSKQLKDASKVVDAASKKLEKATAAAEAGRTKLAAKLAALDPAPAEAATA